MACELWRLGVRVGVEELETEGRADWLVIIRVGSGEAVDVGLGLSAGS